MVFTNHYTNQDRWYQKYFFKLIHPVHGEKLAHAAITIDKKGRQRKEVQIRWYRNKTTE